MPEQVALSISNDTKREEKKSGEQIELILSFLFNCNNQDNIDPILAFQLTLTHKRQLSLVLEEFEQEYLFIDKSS